MFEKISRKKKLDRRRSHSDATAGGGSAPSITADLDQGLGDAESLVRTFMKNTTVAMFVKDLDSRYVLVNATCERLWRLPADQINGRTDRDILPERDAQRLIENDRRVIETGRPLDFEEYIDFPGGRRVFATSKMPMRDRSGRLLGLCGVATEITARTPAEARLRQSDRRLRRMVSVEGFGALLLAASGTVIHANEAFLSMLGYTREEFETERLTWRAMTPAEYIELSERQWRRLEETGRIGPYEKEVLHKDGSRSWMMFSGTSLGDGTVVKYCMDISSRKRAEDALRESDQAKDRFLAVLSHELRNPLAPLRAGLELLGQAERNPAIIDDVRSMMDRQLSHLIRLVDDLLDISRIGRGKVVLQRAPFDLNVAVGAAIEQTNPLLSERGHELTVDLSDAFVSVTGDMERLTQVMTNLLNNAAKYTEPGGTIGVTCAAEEGVAVVCVRDTGCGIPREYQDHLFKLFSQFPGHKQPGGGLGIGLALSRQLIEMHGGSIEAKSEGLGHGSEFVLRLPLSSEEPQGAVDPIQDPAPGRARRVLIVDDNIDAAEGLRMLIELDGHSAQVAHDGPVALEIMGRFAAEVVLLDLGLPGMDGYEVARQIRAMPGRDPVLMVAITGWGQEEDRRRTKDAGFDEHLVKPVDFKQLSALISRQ